MIYHLTRKRLSERARNCKRIPNWTRCSITKRLLKRDIRRSSPIYSRQRPSSDSISVVIFEPCHLIILFVNRVGLSSSATGTMISSSFSTANGGVENLCIFGVKIWTEISIRVKKIDITNVGRHKDGHKDKKTQRQRQKHKQKKTKPQKQTNKQTI